jgi:uncharacterized protein
LQIQPLYAALESQKELQEHSSAAPCGKNASRVESCSMIDKALLEILVCPACKVPVSPKGDFALKCPKCLRVYPIKNDIPIMLIDEAKIDPA